MIDPIDASNSNPANVPLQEGWKYEAAVVEVEKIIARIEAGELELEEVFDQFAVAVKYLHQCETFLQQRQQQVDLLIETLKDEPQF
ncbi:exodeoxyribonuclease VII small subunit [Chroococcidiopsis sp. CCMEE 29]|uniref:exodeoxyribonuclease VII small subunit n=1 Tax=Chroococcidiopsis sp. CCMEE 29 TaxID=155894 RepID=UPI002021B627|nr:exodeoxyribonuclease VII small subunit [Chroococcidiopsis sp. CCMEE 29]